MQLGLVCGELFENQRREDTVRDLKKILYRPGLSDDVVSEKALHAVLGVVFGTREVLLVGDLLDTKYRTISAALPKLRPRGKCGAVDARLVCKDTKTLGKVSSLHFEVYGYKIFFARFFVFNVKAF